MTQSATIRTSLIASIILLSSNSIAGAQVGLPVGVPVVVKNRLVPIIESESIAKPTKVMSATQSVDKSSGVKKEQGAAIPQARPGERVTNPAHGILNLDTTLGGVEVKGTKPTDYGYLGPGDMRTHLWNAHSQELIANGITEYKIMAMTVPEVQQWHNYFHGVEGSPEHPHDDDEQNHLDTSVQQPMMVPSPAYGDASIQGSNRYEDSGYYHLEYPQSVYNQPGIIYQQGEIVQEFSPSGFETQMQPMILNQGVMQSAPIDRKASSRRVRRGK